MPTIVEHLRQNDREEVPRWLREFDPVNGRFDRDEFFGSRVVYYPGAGTDGQAVAVFGASHAAHCFVLVDYLLTEANIRTALGEHGFRGYGTRRLVRLTEQQLTPRGWTPHLSPEQTRAFDPRNLTEPYALLAILEREDELTDDHGPERHAVIFLSADAYAAYDALFCQDDSRPAYAMLLAEHGYGGNWNRFGSGGHLEKLANLTDSRPYWLLVAENTEVWNDYLQVPHLEGVIGGMHRDTRRLFERLNRRTQRRSVRV